VSYIQTFQGRENFLPTSPPSPLQVTEPGLETFLFKAGMDKKIGFLKSQGEKKTEKSWRLCIDASDGKMTKNRHLSADIKGILIVDDEPEFVKTLHRHLRREGFTLFSASDGRKAREQIEQSLKEDNRIQVVVTDILMPRMDGIELMQWIKAFHPKISLLAVSGFSETIVAQKLIRPDMDEYCQKPFTPNRMMALLSSIQKKRRKSI
jgi:CheY-like chemotaxis protein